MTVKDAITRIIRESSYVSVPIIEKSNLYTDLGFDSLSFAAVLAEIEDELAVSFDITEMEACLQIDRLIATVENKIKERNNDQTFSVKP